MSYKVIDVELHKTNESITLLPYDGVIHALGLQHAPDPRRGAVRHSSYQFPTAAGWLVR